MTVIQENRDKLFGRSSLVLPKLAFGSAPLGNLYQSMTDENAAVTLGSAMASGLHYIDTAPHYGFGLSEVRVGNGIAQQRNDLILSSKVGRLLVPTQSTETVRHGFVDAPALEPVFDYTYDAIMKSFESSVRRLKVDTIDILFAHDLGQMTHGELHQKHWQDFTQSGYKAMSELREQGLVKAIGLGANEWQVCEAALDFADFDGFLLAGRYTLLEQSALESFFPLCEKRNASVIVGGPFNSGILATGVGGVGPFYYNYEPAPQAILEKVQRLEKICADFSVPLAAAALQFPLAQAPVVSVLAGFASPAQVSQSVSWMSMAIPSAFWHELREQNLIHHLATLPA